MSDFKMSERKLWKVAVIGCGAFANWEYLPNIRSEANADIVAAVDIIPERAQKACEDYNISNWYKSVFELIENCDFDIAIDAASIQAHHEINMAVLSAGKHLITQKPAAPSVELLNEQIALADKNNVKMVCVPIHPMRYDLNIAKQMIKDNAIGTPYYAKCNLSHGGPEYFQYRNADPTFFFEPGAGALVDMGVHGLQIVTSVFGAVKKIMCMAKVTTPERIVRSGAYNGKVIKADKIPDQYIISLDFGGNKMAIVDTGFSQKASKAPQLRIREMAVSMAAIEGRMRPNRGRLLAAPSKKAENTGTFLYSAHKSSAIISSGNRAELMLFSSPTTGTEVWPLPWRRQRKGA